MSAKARLAAALLLAGAAAAGPARGEEVVSLDGAGGWQQRFLFQEAKRPFASVVLLAGGMARGKEDFLVRNRGMFLESGFHVATFDAPSDREEMNASFRMSPDHAADIAAVVRWLKAKTPLPVWLVGTSTGTLSAVHGAADGDEVDGLVLTSTVTRSPPDWKIAESHPAGVIDMNLAAVRVPVLLVAHRDDACELSPAADLDRLAGAFVEAVVVEKLFFAGGDEPRGDPCEALSAHGFPGLEQYVVGAIADFIKADSP